MGTIKRKRERDPWAPPLRLQTVRAKLVSRPIPARMAKAQWQVFDSSKDETHCSSPGRPSSTSFHGVGFGRQEARTSAKVPRANQTRCVGQPRIRARALTLGNLGGQVHKEPGRHRRLSTGYSGPRGCCVPVWIGGVTRQGRGVETSVCLIRFQFTGAPQTENGLQSHGRREEVRVLSGAGVNAYLGRVTDRGLPLPAVVDTPQGSHKAGCAGVGAGLRTGLSC